MAASSLIRQLLSYVYIVGLALARGRVINIFNGEKGDLAQYHRARRSITDGKFHNAIFNNSQNKWNLKDPNGYTVIPYVISGQYDTNELDTIAIAMKRIRRNTCVRFRKRRSEEDYVDIHNRRSERCYAFNVGRQTGRNVLMLEANEDRSLVLFGISNVHNYISLDYSQKRIIEE